MPPKVRKWDVRIEYGARKYIQVLFDTACSHPKLCLNHKANLSFNPIFHELFESAYVCMMYMKLKNIFNEIIYTLKVT